MTEPLGRFFLDQNKIFDLKELIMNVILEE